MHFGLNLLYLLPGIVGGTEIYAAGLLRGLARVNQNDKFSVFVNQESAQWPLPSSHNFARVVCPISAGNRSNRYFFEQLRFPKLLKDLKIDLIHSLGYVGPLRTPCPSIVTIPDTNFIGIKHTMSIRKKIFFRFFSTQSAHRANHIITISNFSKGEICKFLRIDSDKVTVTYLGPRENGNIVSLENWQDLKRLYKMQEPYIVAFGVKAIHKNVPLLINAFSIIKNEFPHHLVLIGYVPSKTNMHWNEYLIKRIIPTGYIPAEHILPILGHAELFVLPSLYEGFGLPVLEAQQAGTAIACSTAGSLCEVAGKGAVYFDPLSIDDMARVISRCLSDVAFLSNLRQLGKENVQRFSWEKTARETLAVYQNVYSACAS